MHRPNERKYCDKGVGVLIFFQVVISLLVIITGVFLIGDIILINKVGHIMHVQDGIILLLVKIAIEEELTKEEWDLLNAFKKKGGKYEIRQKEYPDN